jgi:hypothetical protein
LSQLAAKQGTREVLDWAIAEHNSPPDNT